MRIGGLYLTDLGYGPGRRKISQIALTGRDDDRHSWLASAALVQIVAHMYRQATLEGVGRPTKPKSRSKKKLSRMQPA
jgi:hypothetical protein